jgi:Flp pilus assembly protein TadD
MSKLWKRYFDKGLDSAKNGQVESSIAYFERSAKLNPLNSEIVYNLGTAYLTLGMPEDAIRSFSEAIKLDSNNSDAFANRSIAYAYNGDKNNSEIDFKRAVTKGADQKQLRLIIEKAIENSTSSKEKK